MNAQLNIIELPSPMKRFVPPTLEEATIYGSQIGLSETECEKFFFFYDSKGWKVGKAPMQRWKSALAGWKLRTQERTEKPSSSVQAIQNQKALERVEERLKYLRGQFPLTLAKQKLEWNELQAERKRLMAELHFKA